MFTVDRQREEMWNLEDWPLGENADLSVEYPDSVERADSEVADSMELDVPERADPGLEKRRGP